MTATLRIVKDVKSEKFTVVNSCAFFMHWLRYAYKPNTNTDLMVTDVRNKDLAIL